MLKKLILNKNFRIVFSLSWVFFLILAEVILGGGGRYLSFGFLTVRMLLFIYAIFYSIFFYLFWGQINKKIFYFIVIYFAYLFHGFIVGFFNQGEFSLILEDIKPLSYGLITGYFSIYVNSAYDIIKITKVIKICTLTLALSYFIVILMLFTGSINYAEFYAKQNEIGEISFRNNLLFFYKGFLYLSVGFFFYITSSGKINKILALFLALAVILTLTRGFILFTLLIYLVYLLFLTHGVGKKIILILTLIVGALIAGPFLIEEIGSKGESDSVRITQIEEVYKEINSISLIIGHGFGNGTEIRPIHMEISFLEIFHKQGLIGLLFWLGVLIFISREFLKINDPNFKTIAIPYYLSFLFTFFQSFTNPFINNPIGMTIMLLNIVILIKINSYKKVRNHDFSLYTNL